MRDSGSRRLAVSKTSDAVAAADKERMVFMSGELLL